MMNSATFSDSLLWPTVGGLTADFMQHMQEMKISSPLHKMPLHQLEMNEIAIPIELVRRILSFLPKGKLLERRLTCRAFAQVAGDPLIGHHFSLSCYQIERAAKKGSPIKMPQLQIKGLNFIDVQSDRILPICSIFKGMAIEKIQLHHFPLQRSPEALEQILICFPFLKKFNLHLTFDFLKIVASRCPFMEKLSLVGPIQWKKLGENPFPHLRSLKYQIRVMKKGTKDQKSTLLLKILQRWPRLKNLTLSDYCPSDLQDAGLDSTPLPSLKKLSLKSCNLPPAILNRLLTHSPDLEALSFYKMDLPSIFWQTAPPNLHLKRLTYEAVKKERRGELKGLKNGDLLHLISKFPNLQELIILQHRLTAEGWGKIEEGALPHLTRLREQEKSYGFFDKEGVQLFIASCRQKMKKRD